MRLTAPIYKLKRQAKAMARTKSIPLHQALDRVAEAEGYRSWSHLARSAETRRPAESILNALKEGDLALVGGRPGHGKTLLGLEMAALAPKIGRRGLFFTLDYNEGDVQAYLAGMNVKEPFPIIDTFDDICAEHIIGRTSRQDGAAIAVVDYMQLLDQKRSHPELGSQIRALKACAVRTGLIVVMISQINRVFELSGRAVPGLSDVRLPNPVDLSLFNLACFLHDGQIEVAAA